MPLASLLAQTITFAPDRIASLDEVERRLAEQRAVVKELRLGVPTAVRIVDPYAESFARAERRWFHD